jgi:RND family efflux transporter MFP subunit
MKVQTAIILCFVAMGCTHNHGHETDTHTHPSDGHRPEAEAEYRHATVFSAEQQAKIDFAVEEVHPRAFGPFIRTVAQIQPARSDEQIISARAAGIVVFTGDNIVEGKAVGAGQSLFSIDGSGTADNNLSVRYNEAQSEYRRAKAEYERKQTLAEDQIVSQSELLQSYTAFARAEALYNSLERNFPQGKQAVGSPVNGFITRLLVRNGQYAEAGQAVLIVSQNRNLQIRAEVPGKYFEALGGITAVTVRIPDSHKTYTLQDLNGKMLSCGQSTGSDRPLIPLLFRVDHKAGLLPGRLVELFIQTQTDAQALTLPNEALVEEMGSYFVYVQQAPEHFEKRAVDKGATDGLRTEIRQGLAAGETVVTKGAVMLKLAQAAGAVDPHSGHSH